MLRAIDEGDRHLVGVPPLQVRIAVDIEYGVTIASLCTDSRNLGNCYVAQVAPLAR
jgi:hypothetical protein